MPTAHPRIALTRDAELDQWLTDHGATPATRSTDELLAAAAALGAPALESPRLLSDTLAEMRAEEDR